MWWGTTALRHSPEEGTAGKQNLRFVDAGHFLKLRVLDMTVFED